MPTPTASASSPRPPLCFYPGLRGHRGGAVVGVAGPLGSLYNHFPGGKVDWRPRRSDLGCGLRRPGAGDLRRRADLLSGIRAFFAAAADHLVENDYADACPIATVALEVASTNETLRQATGRRLRRLA